MSKIEVNAVEPQSGTTLTLGASGDTVALAAGALQTGFGRTGTVDWSSTIRSSDFTAVNGVGYFVDTSAGAVTVTLPASPSVGDIVAIKDWSSTAATNNIIIGRNGQEIEGNTVDGAINIHGDAQTLVFSGASRGWMVVNSGLLEGIQGPQYVAATGGTVLTCGNYKVHVFTGPGSFVVTDGGDDLGSNSVEYLVVAGGGSGGRYTSAGGGAGGFRQNFPSPAIAGLPVTATTYPITVGAGGASVGPVGPTPGVALNGNRGSNSIFSTITSTGGGGGGGCYPAVGSVNPNGPGGSGGGGGRGNPTTGWLGNTPPVSPSQGNNGGGSAGLCSAGGGGGGAGAAGTNGTSGNPGPGSSRGGGAGGIGSSWANPLFGPTAPSYGTAGPVPGVRYFAGGGAGGTFDANPGTTIPGGAGGGGPSFGNSGAGPGGALAGTAGTANTGGGGGSCSTSSGWTNTPGAGGSGIVVIRYKYQ
jgi:hypothetical protein